VATTDIGRKRGGGLLCPFRGQLGPRLIQCGLGKGPLPCQVASSSIQPFCHNRHGPKIGGSTPFLGRPVLGPHLTQFPLGLHTKWHLDPSSHLVTTDMGRKLGGSATLGEGELHPHLAHVQGRGLPACQVSS